MPRKRAAYSGTGKIHSALGRDGHQVGINRTVAQVHALLYLAAKPLPADEISTTLRWRGRMSAPVCANCRAGNCAGGACAGRPARHFETLKDVWEIFRIVAEERKKREIDPTLRYSRNVCKKPKAGRATRTLASGWNRCWSFGGDGRTV